MDKEKRIEKELERLIGLFSVDDKNQFGATVILMQNAAFMKITLEDLQKQINEEGVTEQYQNGLNQHGIKQSAALQSYNALVKSYAGVMKTIQAMLPLKREKPLYSPFGLNRPEKTAEQKEAERLEEEERQKRIQEEIDRAVAFQRQQREEQKARCGAEKSEA